MQDKNFTDQIKASMDAITQDIDVSTQVKLNEARHAAINQRTTPFRMKRFKYSLAGASLALALAVLMVMNQPVTPESTNENMVLFEDLEMLSHEADTDFYEDLEFLAWLEASEWAESDI